MHTNSYEIREGDFPFYSVVHFKQPIEVNIEFAALLRKLLTAKPLIVLRNLTLTKIDVLRIGCFLGNPTLNKSTVRFDAQNPYLTYLESRENVAPFFWHNDGFYLTNESIVKCILFYCEKNINGDARTLFINMQNAYAALSEKEQAFFSNNKAHYFSFDNETKLSHSLVQTSAFNQKPSLFFNAVNLDHIESLDHDSSEQLIVSNLEKAVTDETVYPHEWQKGDLVLVDNIAMMHAADDTSTKEFERLIWRMIIQ